MGVHFRASGNGKQLMGVHFSKRLSGRQLMHFDLYAKTNVTLFNVARFWLPSERYPTQWCAAGNTEIIAAS